MMETVNRNRTISLYCMLTGRYNEYCSKCAMTVDDRRRARYISEHDATEFLAYITPAVERFCGDAFAKGMNPDVPPHPVAIAVAIRHGRSAIRETLAMLGCPGELDRVWEMMKAHGMTVARERQ